MHLALWDKTGEVENGLKMDKSLSDTETENKIQL
jgi:hypothetical protein